MKLKELTPDEIVTLNDFPVHNLHILKIYFRIYQKGDGEIIPPCPVISKDLVVPLLSKDLLKKFNQFMRTNKKVKYFLLDGSHKSTAAALTKNKIRVMVFESDSDISEAKQLVSIGELFSLTVEDTIKDNIKELNKHLRAKEIKEGFMTVGSKTRNMIKERVIPDYMMDHYKKIKK